MNTAADPTVNTLREKANARAHRIAEVCAEELIRSEFEEFDVDQFRIPGCQADDHIRECMEHLTWCQKAFFTETDDGYFVVTFTEL